MNSVLLAALTVGVLTFHLLLIIALLRKLDRVSDYLSSRKADVSRLVGVLAPPFDAVDANDGTIVDHHALAGQRSAMIFVSSKLRRVQERRGSVERPRTHPAVRVHRMEEYARESY